MEEPKIVSKQVLFEKTVQTLQPILGLSDWQIKLVFVKMSKKMLADCYPSPEYKLLTIRLNLNTIEQYNDLGVIGTAIHEMVHALTWELASWADSLCKKDPVKLNITRKYDEALVSSLERTLGNLVGPLIQEKLRQEGYADLDLTFEKFSKFYDTGKFYKQITE